MNSSFGDNKKRLGSSASSLTEVKRRAVVAQTWDFNSKQAKLPSASFSTTVQGMQGSTLAFQNARNAGVVPSISLIVDVPTTTLTATVAATSFTPVRIINMVAIAGTPVFSVSPALPFGLSFSASTGTISGTPMETISATAFTVTVSATSIYPTPYSTTASFYLTVGDATAGLTYQGYTSTPLSSTLPSIFNAPSTWGTRNDSIISGILSSTVNQIFDAESTPSEQNIASYFSGYFKAPESGSYTFGYSSDDGIQLRLGGTTIVNAPGSSQTSSGTSTPAITLVANRYYTFDGLWSQGGGPGNLLFNAITIGGTNKIGTYPIKTRFYR
jgi:hypothetical protein